jgi:diguanylate cyclase (GGDEF)-like protein
MELVEARDSLALQQSLLETTLAHIDDGVALLDDGSRVLIANHAFASMLGMPRGLVEGMTRDTFVRNLAPFLTATDGEGLAEALSAQRPGVARAFEFTQPRRRILSRTWTPVALADADGMLVTWRDVTAEHDLLREREQLLLVDTLTGIANRRAADMALRTEHQRMKRTATPFCVALFDIDHFKRVNDVFGHAAGDEVLRVVAGSLAGHTRLTDTVARWGGEEFVAVLNVPLEGARVFCERARQKIEMLETPRVGRVTISVGLAQVGAEETLSAALERADKHLYEAKAGGRNRVCPG